MSADVLARAFDGLALVAGRGERPADVRGDANHVGVVAVGRALVDEVGVRLEAAVGLLLRREPVLRPLDEPRVDFVDARHVGELHQPVGRENLVRGRLAEPREAAALDLEGDEPLVAERDVAFGLRLNLRRQLLARLEVVEDEHVRVGRRGGLLEAAARHLQDGVEPFDHLRERAGVELHEYLRRAGDGLFRYRHLFRRRAFEPLVDDDQALLAVRHDGQVARDRVARLRALAREPARHL